MNLVLLEKRTQNIQTRNEVYAAGHLVCSVNNQPMARNL